MSLDPRDAQDVNDGPDPTSVYYRVGPVVIDGPALPVGSEVGLRVLGTITAREPVTADAPDREPAADLRVVDWSGPWLEPHNPAEPIAIATHILDAAEAAISGVADEVEPGESVCGDARKLARAAIEAVARRIRPTDDEATAMVLGVLRLDIKKLTGVGDRMAAMLKSHEDLVALWAGVAHNDWEAHRARRAAEEETP